MREPLPYRSPWMDEELDDLAEMAGIFFDREIVPNIDRFIAQHAVDREVWTKAGQQGLLLPSVPEEYGGAGGTFAHEAVILTAQGYATDDSLGHAIHSGIVPHYIMEYGTEEQKKEWLPKLASGEWVAALGMTEPGTGSDVASIRTKAVRDGDEYVINGAKTFITNGGLADFVLLACRTGEAGAKGISMIGVPVDGLAGYDKGRDLAKIGMQGSDTRELSFTDVRVPVANLLGGEEGKGFAQMMQQLPQERLCVSVSAVANMEKAVALTIAYTKEREAFGQPLIDFQNTGFELAEVSTDALAARTFLDHCIGLHLRGELDAVTASRLKYWTTDMQGKVLDRCLQLFGGYGFMAEYPIARMYSGARVQRIYAGSNEIMKVLIHRSL
ncbi:acyl-CoA dehydrogenase [Propionibacteriaceae bacterium ES.041]|uniref:Acyl-[acyl-carrier-protein] dehydrogenase MbtN n=1 Tax=Enemella evansiae TaxID=2016499 RepID=A0A255GL62_9ACTN|nr:acyl-CoA dehydrogenase family protein [Enemella evansiae]OYN96392.1 acyl-CoA dehydrogenase [Enemella evansiae]OYO16311.1 acyl-CoA dehydrogenase [Enemella evansiae]PFG65644.1 acyl-CoA dehydrogenase [Propionibacteriaceae bacterium ES.041]